MPFKFRGINKNEGRFIIVALLLIGIFSYFNFQQSYIRARDVARKNDLKHIAAALNNYFYDFNQYPPSRNGRILVCGNPEYPTECKWGLDGIKDLLVRTLIKNLINYTNSFYRLINDHSVKDYQKTITTLERFYFEIDRKSEKEIETILVHLEKQEKLMQQVLKKLKK